MCAWLLKLTNLDVYDNIPLSHQVVLECYQNFAVPDGVYNVDNGCMYYHPTLRSPDIVTNLPNIFMASKMQPCVKNLGKPCLNVNGKSTFKEYIECGFFPKLPKTTNRGQKATSQLEIIIRWNLVLHKPSGNKGSNMENILAP